MYFEDIQSREPLQIFDKACEGFKVESLPVEICQDMLKNSSYQTRIAHTEAASSAIHVCMYLPPVIKHHVRFSTHSFCSLTNAL